MASTSSETSNNTCSICYDAVQIRGKLNCCDHLFCFGCIETWSKDSNACPLCKNKFRSVTKVEDGKAISKRTVPKRQFHHEYDAEYYGVPEHLIYGGDDEYLDALDDMDVDENGNLLGFIADEDEDDFSEEDLEEEIIFDEQDELEEPEVRFRSRHSSNNTVVLSDSDDEEEEPEAASFLYDEPEEDENIIPFEEDDEEEEDEIDPQMRYFYEEAEEADSEEERQMEQETTRNRRRILQQQEEEERVEQIRPQFRRIPDRRRSRLRSQIIDLSDSQQEPSSQESKDTAEEIEVIPNPVYTSPARRRLIKRKKLNNKVIELDKSASVLLDEEDQVASSSSSSDSSRTEEEEVEIEISPVNYNNGKSVLGKRKQNKKTQVVDLSDESDTEVLDIEIIRKAIHHAKHL